MDLLLMFSWVPLLLLVGHLHRREGEHMWWLRREVEESVRLTGTYQKMVRWDNITTT